MATEAQVIEALFITMSAAYVKGIEAAKPKWSMIATEVPSSGASNFYGWLKDIPGIVEWVGARQLADMGKIGYSIDNKTWETSISVKREDVDDDQIGKYTVISEKFGEDVALFPDSLSFGLLKLGFTELCFDGQPFFDADHPIEGGGTFTNVVGDPDVDTGEPWFLLDTTKVLKPIIYQNRRPFNFKNFNPNEEYTWVENKLQAGTDGRCNVGFGFPQTAIGSRAALSEANYEKAQEILMEMKKASGVPLGTRGTTIVVGPKNRAAARKLFKMMLSGGGDTNIYFDDVEIVDSPYITV